MKWVAYDEPVQVDLEKTLANTIAHAAGEILPHPGGYSGSVLLQKGDKVDVDQPILVAGHTRWKQTNVNTNTTRQVKRVQLSAATLPPCLVFPDNGSK
eukprot:COSAG01_NODE_774_length_13702_cov_11.108726_4_plen_98_part_00